MSQSFILPSSSGKPNGALHTPLPAKASAPCLATKGKQTTEYAKQPDNIGE